MKRILILLFLITLLAFGGLLYIYNQESQKILDQTPVSTTTTVYKYTYFQNSKKDIHGVVFDSGIKLIYDTSLQKTVRDLSKDNNFTVSINGGFFTGDKTYAGLLVLNGVQKSQIALLDKQLTGSVLIKENTISILPITSINPDDFIETSYTVFQTGPIIIKDDKVNSSDILKSVNGNGEYIRSILGYTDSGDKFFLITTKAYTLNDLADEVLKLDVFQGKNVNAINLDGGSSTFIYSSENKDYNIGSFKKLPIILGVE